MSGVVSSFRTVPLASQRGVFAADYTTCLGCLRDLLDVDGTGVHPDPECARKAAARGEQSS